MEKIWMKKKRERLDSEEKSLGRWSGSWWTTQSFLSDDYDDDDYDDDDDDDDGDNDDGDDDDDDDCDCDDDEIRMRQGCGDLCGWVGSPNSK